MKKTLFALIAIFAMVLTSCGANDVEKQLNGKWQTEMNQAGEAMTMTMDLNAENHNVGVDVAVFMEGEKLATISFAGSWKASSNKLTLSFDDDKCTVDFSDAFKEMASSTGMDLSEMEKEISKSMKDELKGMAQDEIVSISETQLVLKEAGSKITFDRVK